MLQENDIVKIMDGDNQVEPNLFDGVAVNIETGRGTAEKYISFVQAYL